MTTLTVKCTYAGETNGAYVTATYSFETRRTKDKINPQNNSNIVHQFLTSIEIGEAGHDHVKYGDGFKVNIYL